MYRRLLENHILTNLALVLVLVMGWMAYFQMPREQDPSVNFNWVQIWTYWPGATAPDVESRVTNPLEEGIKRVADVKFVSSTSREGLSSILVRFTEMSRDEFDKHTADLRREIQTQIRDLPENAEQPEIVEISSSNAFPTATLVVWGRSGGEQLQRVARKIKEDLERLEGVDNIATAGAADPELKIYFQPERLLGLGVSPVDLADTVGAYFQDMAAGHISIGDQKWPVRVSGTSSDPTYLGSLPIVAGHGEVPMRSVAEIERSRADLQEVVRYRGDPAVLLSVFKAEKANNLQLVEGIKGFLARQNSLSQQTGVEVVMLDDQTQATRLAIGVMEGNALIGLLLVVLVTWLAMGTQAAAATVLGIPFVLAGTFLLISMIGQTLNVTVLLAVVISLGMLVDDSVVILDAIHFQLQRGKEGVEAAIAALREVAWPVSTAVLTTIAAFLPLMLLPGLLGDFMRVVPIVVSIALVVSLVEAFWVLPSHMAAYSLMPPASRGIQTIRTAVTLSIRRRYSKLLVTVLRRPRLSIGGFLAIFTLAMVLLFAGLVRVDFFATDLYRFFYVSVEMPPGTSLEKTSNTLATIDDAIREKLSAGGLSGTVSYAGQQFTETELLKGNERGQILVSLDTGSVDSAIDGLRDVVASVPGPISVSFIRRKTGPPTAKPISVKIRGDDIAETRAAASALKQILFRTPGVSDISDDDDEGGMELSLKLNPDAVTRAALDPADVMRAVRLLANGEVVASMHHLGEKLDVRVQVHPRPLQDTGEFLSYSLGLANGGEIPLAALLNAHQVQSTSTIRHYDFRRTLTIDAELDSNITDTLSANRKIQKDWMTVSSEFPGVSLEFSGEMDDIQESLEAMAVLFLFGVGLIYVILGTQFKSYLQPFLVLTTIPMAFVGVVFGLFVSGNPLSLFTIYGAIALAGIGANDAIVLISTANSKLGSGVSTAQAAFYAARRRIVPILITSVTTIAGLLSLATGLGGKSLIWGPLATAIVWGLAFSTLLTLFVVPLSYQALVKRMRGKDVVDDVMDRLLPIRSGVWPNLVTRLYRSIDAPEKARDVALDNVLRDSEYKNRYDLGMSALQSGDAGQAIRCFEWLAKNSPQEIASLNLFAAQANLQMMQAGGWDIGYMERARKYLERAKRLDPNDHRITLLERACAALDAGNV